MAENNTELVSLSSVITSSGPVRTVTLGGRPWFVLRDVLRAMGSRTTVTNAAQKLLGVAGQDHYRVALLAGPGGPQQTKVVSEEGLYYTMLRSAKAQHLALEILSKIAGYREILKALEDFEVPEDLPDMFVYAIREKDTGNVKLGISRDPEKRMKQLQTGNSSELELVAFRRADNRFVDERALHEEAADFRIRGEWFDKRAMPLHDDAFQDKINEVREYCDRVRLAREQIGLWESEVAEIEAVSEMFNKITLSYN